MHACLAGAWGLPPEAWLTRAPVLIAGRRWRFPSNAWFPEPAALRRELVAGFGASRRSESAAFLVDPAGNRIEAVCHAAAPELERP